MSEFKVWSCKFGIPASIELPNGFDAVPRNAVVKAVSEALGIEEGMECFSGWGASFTEQEKAIIKDEPIPATNPTKDERIAELEQQLAKLREALQKIADGENNLGWSPCSYIAKQALLEEDK